MTTETPHDPAPAYDTIQPVQQPPTAVVHNNEKAVTNDSSTGAQPLPLSHINNVDAPQQTASPGPNPNMNIGARIVPIQAAEMVTPLSQLGDHPEWIDCPFCERRTKTRVVKEDSSMTMFAGVVLCLLCVCLACVPCMAGWFADVDHFCENCNRKVTHRPHDGAVQVLEPNARGTVSSQYPHAAQTPYPQQSQMQYAQQNQQQPQQNQQPQQPQQQQHMPKQESGYLSN